MSTVNYKKNKQGFQKIRSLINEPKTVMLATRLHKAPFAVCPMTLLHMDEQRDLWFVTAIETQHFTKTAHDNRVHILYTGEQHQPYLSVFGNATRIVDNTKVGELWNPMLNSCFPGGKQDSNLA